MDRSIQLQEINSELLQIISAEQAYHYRVIPIEKSDSIVFLTDIELSSPLLKDLRLSFDERLDFCEVKSEEIEFLLSKHYRSEMGSVVLGIDGFLKKIILEAHAQKASDVHFDPTGKGAIVRYRIDGVLISRYSLDSSQFLTVINQIKISGGMDLSEKRLPQDGRMILLDHDGKEIEFRLSIIPTVKGEKVVVRILSKDKGLMKIDRLQMGDLEDKFRQSLNAKSGLILISGPTGSGKTTTLYAALNEINTPQINIVTIEDPVEYGLDGISQVALKEDIGLNFSTALRSFLRQDPDVIMIGEIRDPKTASMAIRSSLTGHLVLSTIHTNSAQATFSRLEDMGIPTYLIKNTLRLSIAQRLLRSLCNNCKELDLRSFDQIKEEADVVQVYKARGCSDCHFTGYKGRFGIFEYWTPNSENTESLKNQAWRAVSKGKTSVDEISSLLL